MRAANYPLTFKRLRCCHEGFLFDAHSHPATTPRHDSVSLITLPFDRLPERSGDNVNGSALFLHRSMWDIAGVKLWPFLPRLLSILAVVSLLIVPMAAPSVATAAAPTGAMEDMASMSDGMPCCLHEKPAVPDCPKSCPLAALRVTGCLPYAPVSGASIPARFAVADVKSPGDDVEPERLTEPPSPRPPRT